MLVEGLMVAGVCLAIAVFIYTLEPRAFGPKLTYSLCIGACCWLFIGLTRRALMAAVTLWRRRIQGPQAPEFHIGGLGAMALAVPGVMMGVPSGLALGDALTGFQSPSMWSWDSFATRITVAVSLAGTVTMMGLMVGLERLAHSRAAAEAAQRAAAENQLRLLQSQLEPHMLFNTLANLRVLIGLDPAQAQQMLDRLIGFLRATLSASRVPHHALSTEFERVDDYLSLMRFRMGPRLQVALDLPAPLRALQVPPLLLQPLVENAIRHGLEPQPGEVRLTVRAQHDGDALWLTVHDTGVGLGASPDTGGTHFGLEQVRERLRTLYGAAAGLSLEEAPSPARGTVARVRLPWAAVQPSA
ncbi:MAG: sensor histidine kinase [Inhella sp.]|uniref:sensor histidine kinase n=1 Tax=Inhella sp. TaxID=1921806 RepID=UPI00391B5347